MSWVSLDDVVRAIHFVASDERASGALNTTAPNPVTNIEFTRVLGQAVHRPAPWIVPAFALKAVFGQMAEDTLLASSRVLPARLESLGFTFRDPAIGPALAKLL
jgi:NAD dependent epimerase/dehydratase family enzyme